MNDNSSDTNKPINQSILNKFVIFYSENLLLVYTWFPSVINIYLLYVLKTLSWLSFLCLSDSFWDRQCVQSSLGLEISLHLHLMCNTITYILKRYLAYLLSRVRLPTYISVYYHLHCLFWILYCNAHVSRESLMKDFVAYFTYFTHTEAS